MYSERNIQRLHNVIVSTVFTYNGNLSYDRVTDAIILLCDVISNTDTDEFVWYIGESGECVLMDLVVGAYWHYAEYHSGQNSKGYRALSALGGIYSPNMEAGPEPESCEVDMCNLMERLHNEQKG